MPQPLILVLDAAPAPRLGRLTGQARIRYADGRSLARQLPDADVLLVWDFTSDAVREAWPGAGPRPRWVHTASAGVDRLLCPELAASPTVVTNARGVFELPIAEYVAGLVLAFAKDLPRTLDL
ncbi:D-2-hydroxyacid dehydrogenase, partial [Streptomyces sp. NPDC001876]